MNAAIKSKSTKLGIGVETRQRLAKLANATSNLALRRQLHKTIKMLEAAERSAK